MLLEKSFHVFRGSWVGFIVVCCLCAVFTLCCDLDVLGIGSYVPKVSSVKSLNVNYAGRIVDPSVIEDYIQLHKDIVSKKDRYENISYADSYEYVTFNYTLKDDRIISRAYSCRSTTKTPQGTMAFKLSLHSARALFAFDPRR